MAVEPNDYKRLAIATYAKCVKNLLEISTFIGIDFNNECGHIVRLKFKKPDGEEFVIEAQNHDGFDFPFLVMK
jgi:hypothetical protein